MTRASPAKILVALAGATAAVLAGAPARADLKLCNRTSYVLDLALGLETKGAAATRGWFRINPGDCRTVLQGAMDAEHVFVHARPHPAYQERPLPLAQHAELCIADESFIVAGARKCPSSGQRLAGFTEVKPSESEGGTAAHIAEEAEYAPAQARLAGIQRLLVLLGYDAEPIDGLEGRKTDAALTQFLRERNLPESAAEAADFFDILLQVAAKRSVPGLSWCNDTKHPVLAALGVQEGAKIVTRGWYRVPPGQCLNPEVARASSRLFSFAEAIDADGRAVRRNDRPLAWGGPVVLCTRDLQFEIAEHTNCADRGLAPTGFAAVELKGGGGTMVRFRE